MDLKLQVKQSQILSQRMIQSAEILQMTSQELNTYVNDLALENPVIDIVEPAAGDDQRSSKTYRAGQRGGASRRGLRFLFP